MNVNDIDRILARHSRYKAAYFWTPPGNAAARRAEEARNSETHEFDFAGDHYEIDQSVSCSARNVYYSLTVKRNGAKKDVRALKALRRDLLAAEEVAA